MPHLSFASPLGEITLFEEGGAIVALDWGRAGGAKATPLLERAKKQLDEYFSGKRRKFDLPLAPRGSLFQRKVWDAMLRIPYGQTRSYGEVAHEVDSGPRAIGGACGGNHIGIIIPCHRVLASQGAIGGYSGHHGLATKRFLLELEGVKLGKAGKAK